MNIKVYLSIVTAMLVIALCLGIYTWVTIQKLESAKQDEPAVSIPALTESNQTES